MYGAQLLRSYEDEVSGAAFFASLAGHFASPASDKLLLLARVEQQTARLLEPLLRRHTLVPRAVDALARQGRSEAPAWRCDQWQDCARRFALEFEPYIEDFRALEHGAPAADRPALALLREHEQAIVDFARDEAGGAMDGSRHLWAYLERLESFLLADSPAPPEQDHPRRAQC